MVSLRIEGGTPTEALVAHVAVARFADHQPLYRQAQMMSRQGVLLDRSTLAFWMGYAAAEMAPVVARLRGSILSSAKLFADETIVPVLDPGRGRTKQGYFWAIARDDRPWGGRDPPAVVYTYVYKSTLDLSDVSDADKRPNGGSMVSRCWPTSSPASSTPRFAASGLDLAHTPRAGH
jgi:hypothetical protein